MRLRACLPLIIGLVSLLFFTGCETPFAPTGPKFNARQGPLSTNAVVTNFSAVELTNQVSPDLLQAGTQPFTLGPGDKIELEILTEPASRTIVTVGPDGKIYFYLLPGTDVWGLTLGQTRDLLQKELEPYIPGAQVSVTLRGIESKRVWLLGRLRNSGVYPVGAPMTLLEAIAAAGGLVSPSGPGASGSDELADLRHSFVVRQGQVVPVDFQRLIKQGDMTQNIYLQPDDFVYVPSAASKDIYVLGAVRLARPVPWQSSSTLVSAITDAGGTTKDAYLSHVAIVRGSLSQPKIGIISYRQVVGGKAADVPLEPGDIVYVPIVPYQTLLKYVNLILDSFARAEAINEGARAASKNAVPVGINIGVGVGVVH